MMKWTEADTEYLRNIRSEIDSDDIKIKEQIKRKLVDNKYIIHVLNNKEFIEKQAEPDDYFGINILPFFVITPSQSNVQNFICFETDYNELKRHNDAMKYQNITFTVMCHERTNVDEETGLARHDLLSALIIREFNYTNIFGGKVMLVTNKPGVVDGHYPCRTLIFEQLTDNLLTKTYNKTPRLANKDIVT